MHLLPYVISNLFVHLNTLLITILSSLSGISPNSHSLDGIAVGLVFLEGLCCLVFLVLLHWDLCIRSYFTVAYIFYQPYFFS